MAPNAGKRARASQVKAARFLPVLLFFVCLFGFVFSLFWCFVIFCRFLNTHGVVKEN